MTPPRKKLIEVALPLEAINKASAREKSIRHGHPSTLHLWWARRPLAAARAVIFAQMVDDPSSSPDRFPTAQAQEAERRRLFEILEQLVQWESTTDEAVLERARAEIRQSWRRTCADHADHPRAKELFDPDRLPAFHDPFAGGGALPLEAQRLGLEAYATDLNPVAVLINKAMIEIPPKLAGQPPVNPEARADPHLLARDWTGPRGLVEDVGYYGRWMRDRAAQRLGHLYPKIEITPGMVKDRPDLKPYAGKRLTVIAWLWARTVKSPNPAFADVDVPLASTFMLSTREGKESYVEPVLEGRGYRFAVKTGTPPDPEAAKNGTKLSRGANFRCVMSDAPISGDYIKAEGKAGRMGARLMAVVAEGAKGRVYLAPTAEHEAIARSARPAWKLDLALPDDPRNFWTVQYGLTTYGDLFTPRQLVALTTFADLVGEAIAQVKQDALTAGLPDDGRPLSSGGTGATALADCIGAYLGCAMSRMANYSATLCVWSSHPKDELVKQVFLRQALPMTWDFAETNPFSSAGGTLDTNIKYLREAIERLPAIGRGDARQADAATIELRDRFVSTDPPYYDNIGYADLSDFFYVWLRRSLRAVFPDLFATVAAPKTEELVASLYRHGSKGRAEAFFLEGMTRAMHRLAEQAHPAFPVTIYYAFKQSESESDAGTASTGWETFLDAVIRAGFAIDGTWPMRTELIANLKKHVSALASSIVLVCRTRSEVASVATRRELIAALRAELPQALAQLQKSNIAPVDLAQASIGPGMAVYTRYAKVLDAEGKPLSVREALALINQVLDEVLAEQEADFDADSRWALAWFEQFGFNDGPSGEADTLSKAKNTAVNGLVEAGIIEHKRAKVRLYRPDELPGAWDPAEDTRLTVWEVVHHVIRVLDEGGERAAAGLVGKLGTRAEVARELGYRLYAVSERKKRAQEALRYNALVQSWPEIARLAREGAVARNPQPALFEQE